MKALMLTLATAGIVSAQTPQRAVPEGGSGTADEGVEYKTEILKVITAGLQFYTSPNSDTWAAAFGISGGVMLNEKHYHGLNYYHDFDSQHDSEFEVDKVWGINYEYGWVNDFETNFIYLTLGAKAGFNYYGEDRRYSGIIGEQYHKTIQFGGPKAQLSLRFGRIGFGGSYFMPLGYREVDDEKSFARSDSWEAAFHLFL